MLSEQIQPVSAIQNWESKFRLLVSHIWNHMVAYFNDPMLNNKTKEKIYKIYTRAFPLGCRMGTSSCAFCGTFEDEMHCFNVKCQRLGPLWAWISNILHASCLWIKDLTEAELLFGYSKLHATNKHLKYGSSFTQNLLESSGFPDVEKFSIMKYCIYKPSRALLCADRMSNSCLHI
jgi:hypothetical protein